MDEKRELLQRTWEMLQDYEVSTHDIKSVVTYEKLAKLYLAIYRQVKQDKKQPHFEELEV